MKLQIYALKDSVVGRFKNLLLFENDSVAVREFTIAVNHPDFKYAEDTSLYMLGTYDDSTGLVEPLVCPAHIRNAVDCIVKRGDVDNGSKE